MEEVDLNIVGTVITAKYGTLVNGDKLTTDKEFAAHLVDVAKSAVYAEKPKAEAKVEARPEVKEESPPAEAKVEPVTAKPKATLKKK